MRKYVTGAVIAVLPALVLAAPGLAQQPRQDRESPSTQRPATDATQPATRSDQPTTRSDRGERRTDQQRQAGQDREGLIEANRLVGMRVMNAAGKKIGEVDRLIVDPKSGRVSHVVVGMGGMLGVGENKVVVPWSEVKIFADQQDKDKLIAQIEQSALDRAPRYERSMTRRDDRDRERTPAASPSMQPKRDSERNGPQAPRARSAPAQPWRSSTTRFVYEL